MLVSEIDLGSVTEWLVEVCLFSVAVEFEVKSQRVHLIFGLCLSIMCFFSACAGFVVNSQMSHLSCTGLCMVNMCLSISVNIHMSHLRSLGAGFRNNWFVFTGNVYDQCWC